MSVRVVHIGSRSDGDEQAGSIGREGQVARPVATALRQFSNDNFPGAARLQLSAFVREAIYAISVSDIHPLRICTQRVECDAEGTVQACGKSGHLLRLAA